MAMAKCNLNGRPSCQATTALAGLDVEAFAKGWLRRIEGTRAVAITPKGWQVFRDAFESRLGSMSVAAWGRQVTVDNAVSQ